MTSEQRRAARTAIGRHLKTCPSCRASQFVLNEDVTFLVQIEGGNIVNLETGQPCVSAACGNCGHVMLFNVFHAGLGDVFGMKPSKATARPEPSKGGDDAKG